MEGPSIAELEEVICNPQEPISKRNRAIFFLRTMETSEAIQVLQKAFYTDSSELFRHEICYALGQVKSLEALPFLISILDNDTETDVTRHEASEALAAIGDESVYPILQKYRNHSIQPIAETCQISLDRLDWLRSGEEIEENWLYRSTDPAPPFKDLTDIKQLEGIYNDTTQSLFTRYRALFSLRDIGTDESIQIIAQGLYNSSNSALFKHEVAFVLGQLGERAKCSLQALLDALKNTENHAMVRHEAAEAIGAVTDDPAVMNLMEQFKNDPDEIVRSSIFVAMDISEYWHKEVFI